MGNFSKPPLDMLLDGLSKGYVGLHVEQGVPVLDRDLNLLNDLISATVRTVIARYIGDGVAEGGDGFRIAALPAENDLRIEAGAAGAGTCLVGGIEVRIEAATDYSAQAGLPALTTPDATQPDPRVDVAYLDVWLGEVLGDEDASLLNGDDVGVQTSVRLRPTWRVRVAEGTPVPAPVPGHAHYPLARLTRPRDEPEISAAMIVDLRQTRLTLGPIEQRLRFLEQIYVVPRFNPSPNQFSPKVGGAGVDVHLFGQNLHIGSPQVLFGAVDAGPVTVVDPTELVVDVPGGVAGPVKLTIITGGGSAVSDDDFTVLAAPPPGNPPQFAAPPDEFTPNVRGAGQTVTLSGTNFDGPNLEVRFANEVAAVNSVTATEIVAVVPAALAGAGGVNITVTTDFGSDTTVEQLIVL